mgnify:CR=1
MIAFPVHTNGAVNIGNFSKQLTYLLADSKAVICERFSDFRGLTD